MTGLHLSQYRIESELGRGGMGIVYKATDTKLNRTVALKVLPPSALASEDDRARFFREAQAAAQLHHPNIATVFQIDEAVPVDDDGKVTEGQTEKRPFIAMEFIEGKTLYDSIKAGPFPLKDAINVAGQVAEALKEAHAKEIVHRDIKSHNIMLTKEGIAKVLDFGLAKTNQSTMLTRMGSTLGTVAYMSPEQARGMEVDGRTDLYALGTVLYEMVAGRLPFAGDYEQAVLYAILNEPPEPLTALRTGVPMELERITAKLLSKEAEYRYQTAGGLLADLKALDITGSGVSRRSMAAMSSQPAAAPSRSLPGLQTLLIAAAALLVGALATWLLLPSGESVGSRAVIKARLLLPDARSPLEAALTPDDRILFYSAVNPLRLVAYDLASGVTRDVERGVDGRLPITSPDGRWVVFFNQSTAEWWRAPVEGGVAAPIRGAASNRRVASGFDQEGNHIFSDSTWSLSRTLPDGALERLARPDTADGPNGLLFALPSPTGRFSVFSSGGPGFRPLNVFVSTADGERERLISGAYAHTLTASGHLLTIEETLLAAAPQTFATPINLQTGAIEGATVAIGAWSYPSAVSPSGLVVYEELGDQSGRARPSTLYRVNEAGNAEPVSRLPGALSSEFAVSSNGSMVAIGALAELRGQTDIFVVDLNSDTVTRLTRDGGYDLPAWGPGDRTLYFDQQRSGGYVILRRNADGSGENEQILPDLVDIGDQDVTPDGNLIAFNDSPLDLYVHDFRTDSTHLVLDEAEGINKPSFSPDGRYIAFVRAGSAWCGSIEVVSATGEGEPIQIRDQGCMPKWTRDGTAIYTEQEGEISRTPVTTTPVFRQTGPTEIVFRGPTNFQTGQDGAFYFDVDAAGTLWVAYPEAGSGDREVWIVSNWFEALNQMAPRDE